MSMHTIEVVYDPTTRRISLTQNTDKYGGATTDNNSVAIKVYGIEPDGESFRARIDFNVQVMTGSHTYQHPFVELEPEFEEEQTLKGPRGDTIPWIGTIPNAVLAATEHTRNKLQFQLLMSNEDYVINSRNSITLEVTQAINAESSDIVPMELPDWEIPENQIPDYQDIHVVELNYDPSTRMLSLANEKSKYGGSTIDTNSVAVVIYWGGSQPEPSQPVMMTTRGLNPAPSENDHYGFRARLDFAVPVMVETGVAVKPFVPLIDPRYQPIDDGGDVQERSLRSARFPEFILYAIIPQPILMSARELKKLPFQLVIREGDVVINSRNTVTLDITRAINAMQSISTAYMPYVMYRDDSWGWLENFTYSEGAVVTYRGEVYVSLVDGNKGNNPMEDDGTHWHSLEQTGSAPTFYYVSSWEEYDELQSVAKVGDYLNIYYSDDNEFMNEWFILDDDHYWTCLSSTNLNGYANTSFPSFYAPESPGDVNQVVVSQGPGKNPEHKTLSRSFVMNFASRPTFNIPLYNVDRWGNYTRWVDTMGMNVRCEFYDNSTMERLVLPYTIKTDATVPAGDGESPDEVYLSIDVTSYISASIRMDVIAIPSLGSVY